MPRQFHPADLADFHTHHRQFAPLFGPARPGKALWGLINSSDVFEGCRIVGDLADFPAALGAAKACWPYISAAPTPQARKQIASAIGGMIRTVMVANGYRTLGIKRAVPQVLINGRWERVFKTGEVYGR